MLREAEDASVAAAAQAARADSVSRALRSADSSKEQLSRLKAENDMLKVWGEVWGRCGGGVDGMGGHGGSEALPVARSSCRASRRRMTCSRCGECLGVRCGDCVGATNDVYTRCSSLQYTLHSMASFHATGAAATADHGTKARYHHLVQPLVPQIIIS